MSRAAFTSERATGIAVAVFVVLLALAILLGGWALSKSVRTEGDVAKVTRRIVRIEAPSPAQRQARVQRAIAALTPTQRRLLLGSLLAAADPEQLAELRGPRGRAGPAGPPGPPGPAGTNGASGTSGSRGAPGRNGTAGGRGQRGDTGPQGPQGPRGPSLIDELGPPAVPPIALPLP